MHLCLYLYRNCDFTIEVSYPVYIMNKKKKCWWSRREREALDGLSKGFLLQGQKKTPPPPENPNSEGSGAHDSRNGEAAGAAGEETLESNSNQI